MLFVDSRIGSFDLEPMLKSLGAPVELTTLEFADCCFVGSGPEGRPVQVGIELKKLNDMLSCITTGRFSGHQLPGLVQNYDEIWLIVEGIYRANPRDGILETYKGGDWRAVELGARRWQYRDLEAFLTTAEVKAGVRVRRTNSRDETARVVAGLYAWWTATDYEDHRSHLALNRSRDIALLAKPSLTRRIANELPGIGFERSGMVAGHFETVRNMVNADESEWVVLPGIGKTIARRIVAEVNGVPLPTK